MTDSSIFVNWPLLVQLARLLPDGQEFDQLTIYCPNDWENQTESSDFKEISRHYKAWSGVDCVCVGSSCYGDTVLVTKTDPVSHAGGIYLLGPDVAGPEGNDNWPAGLLRLELSTFAWVNRLRDFGDEFAVSPGGIEEAIAEKLNTQEESLRPISERDSQGEGNSSKRAEQYRDVLRSLNPGLSW
jgi:hypothetical protein